MTDSRPDIPEVAEFRFLRHDFDAATGTVTLEYSFDGGEPLQERIVFPHRPWPSEPSRQAAFLNALQLLHFVAGVSYWKACIPPYMDTGEPAPDEATIRFLSNLYTQGLAEFAHVNELDLVGRVRFGASGVIAREPPSLDLPDRDLLPVGGGKDSLVSLQVLADLGREVQPVCIGSSKLIAETVKVAKMPLIRIERELAPQLKAMNAAGALNGHVPVTAIHSAILVCAALLYGYRNIVFSNESSASEPTLVDRRGREVNHQWSKSLSFEKQFREVIEKSVSPDIEYFSLLRPLNEMTIARRFSNMSLYHPVFSSCNRNFHLDGPRTERRWCGDCPKCRFTTLALAPHLSPGEVKAIIGTNLLDEPAQLDGFRALCRLGTDKPLECVGTIEECRAALAHIAGMPAWKDARVVTALAESVSGPETVTFAEVLSQRGEHCIPYPELCNALG